MARTLLAGVLPVLGLGVAARADVGMAHYPRDTTNTTTALPTATDHASHNCSWSWSSWTANEYSYTSYTSFNLTSTYTYHNITASTTVGCDNITRIVGDLTTVATGTNVTVVTNYTSSAKPTGPTPTCSLPVEDCVSLFGYEIDDSLSLREKLCTRPATSAQKVCGQCGIVGGTIDLLYFPPPRQTPAPDLCSTKAKNTGTLCPLGPTTATNNATNPYDNHPCYYATGTTSTTNSGPYIVSDGYTFYENRAYISLASVYATDQCGYVGEQHSGTVVEVASTDVYSIGGYHHYFADMGYSFNFQDLYNPPSSAYYLNCDSGGGVACVPQQGTRFTPGIDYINGARTMDLGRGTWQYVSDYWIWSEAYAPIILMPTQIRSLDPAWSTCVLDLGGLYDPPRALTQTSAVGPTVPTPDGNGGDSTTTAQPGNSPGNTGPGPTAGPTTTPVPAEPVLGPTDDDTTTVAQSPVVQPTGGGQLDTPTDNDGSPAGDDDGNTDAADPATQNPGGIVASLLNGGTAEAEEANSQPTGTTPQVGDLVASVLGMAASPSAQDPSSDPQSDADPAGGQDADGSTTDPTDAQNGDDSPSQGDDPSAPAPVIFTGADGTHTASAIEGSENVFVVDGTNTVTASPAGTSGSGAEIEVDGQTFTVPAPSDASEGTEDNGSSNTASGSETGSVPAQQTGNLASRIGVQSEAVMGIAGGLLFLGVLVL